MYNEFIKKYLRIHSEQFMLSVSYIFMLAQSVCIYVRLFLSIKTLVTLINFK